MVVTIVDSNINDDQLEPKEDFDPFFVLWAVQNTQNKNYFLSEGYLIF